MQRKILKLAIIPSSGGTAGWTEDGGIKIGNDVGVSNWSKLMAGSHNINDPYYRGIFRPIVFKDYAYIFTGAMILQGVTMGEGAIVMAGSVVRENVKA